MPGPWERYASEAQPTPEPAASEPTPAGEGPWARYARSTRDSAAPRLVPLENPTGTPIWMRDNPGITPDNSSAPSRDIPAATPTQQARRAPEADLGDWARYLSGASFLFDTLPGVFGDRGAQQRTNELVGRVRNTVTGANAQPGVNEFILQAPVTRLPDGRVASMADSEWWRDEGRQWGSMLNFALDANPMHRAEQIRATHPEAEFRRDERGNLQVRRTRDEPWTYLNRPGASVTDLTDLAGTLIKYLPAARAAAIPRSFSGRALTGALASGATEYAAQEIGRLVGGPGADGGDVAVATLGGGLGQGAFDIAAGAFGPARSLLYRTLGVPETRIPLPEPPALPGESVATPRPAGRPDAATRGTREEIVALENELAALRERGPQGVRDPNDPHAIGRQLRAEEAGEGNGILHVSEGNSVQQQQARQRWSDEIGELERRIATARQPYFAEGPPEIPVNSDASDAPFDVIFQALRNQRIPADAGEALAVRMGERLERQIGEGGAVGETGSGLDLPAIRAMTGEEYTATRNSLSLLDRIVARGRIGTATYREAQQVRNALRHFENTSTGPDRRAVQRLLFAYDEWLDLAFSTQRPALANLTPTFDAATQSINARTGWMARADAPPATQTPIHTAPPPPLRPGVPPTRAQVRQAFDEQGIDASRGQISQDVRALQREDDLIQSGQPDALAFANRQAAQVERRLEQIATRGAPPLTQTADDAGAALAQDIQRQFRELDELADDTYEQAFRLLAPARVPSDAAEPLGLHVRTRLERGTGQTSDPMFQHEDTGLRWGAITGNAQTNYPGAAEALRIIGKLQDDIATGGLNFAVVARRRQNLNAIRSANGNDGRALRNIRHGFDEWLNAQMGRSQTARMTTVDEVEDQALQAQLRAEAHRLHQEANAIWSERQRLYGAQGPRDPGGALLERIRDPRSGMTGTQVLNGIFSAKMTPTNAAIGALRRIRQQAMGTQAGGRMAPRGELTEAQRAFDDGGLLTPPMQILREGFWHRIRAPLTSRRDNRLVPARAIASNLERALTGDGAALTRMLHTPAEIEQMHNILRVLKWIERPIGVNTSGTAITMQRMLGGAMDALAGTLPTVARLAFRTLRTVFGGSWDDMTKAAEARGRFSRPLMDVDFGRSPSGAAYGQIVIDRGDSADRPSVDPGRPARDQSHAPAIDWMEGVSDLTSHSAGTVTFKDGEEWVTLPTIVGDQQFGVGQAVMLWREGRLRPLVVTPDEAQARAIAQGYRTRTPATETVP